LANLDQNVIDQLTTGATTTNDVSAPTDSSASPDAAQTGTPAPAAPDASTEPAVDDTGIDEATATRVQQENAALRATLMKVGIDPDSDVAENLRSGLITVDDILRTRQPQQPTAQSTQEPEAQPPTLDQKLQSLQKRLGRSDPVTNEEYKQDMSAALDVIGTLVRDIQDGKREQNTQRLFEEVTTSTKEVFSSQLKDKIRLYRRQISPGCGKTYPAI
jgi:hypothetical protein